MESFEKIVSEAEKEKRSEEAQSREIDTLRSEHLKEGVPPIMACVEAEQFFDKEFHQELIQGSKNVNYHGSREDWEKHDIRNAGEGSYVISPVDKADKFSERFRNCTGLIAAGLERETGENISFLTHQDPIYFLGGSVNQDAFLRDIREKLRELKEKSAEGTIDAVVVGGNYFKKEEWYKMNYILSVKLLSDEVRNVLGFEPVVITGPKTRNGNDHVFYDNKQRRLYIIRPNVGVPSTESFTQKNLKAQREKWESESGGLK